MVEKIDDLHRRRLVTDLRESDHITVIIRYRRINEHLDIRYIFCNKPEFPRFEASILANKIPFFSQKVKTSFFDCRDYASSYG